MAFINREISWLKFNDRVLHQATLTSTPFFEKLRFIDIARNNADEFYMVRVGSLQELSSILESNDNKTNLSISQQLKLINKHYQGFLKTRDSVFNAWLSEAKQFKIFIKTLKELKNNDVQYLETFYKSQIEPLLSPMVIGPSNPFPFIQNNQIVVVALLKKNKKKTLGLIPLDNRIFPLILSCPSSSSLTMVNTSSIIQDHIGRIFKGYEVEATSTLQLIRNADLDYESSYDEELSMKDVMKKLLKRRQRLAPVRLDLQNDHPELTKEILKRLPVPTHHVFINASTYHSVVLKQVEAFLLKRHPEAFYPVMSAREHPEFRKERIENIVKKRDVFLHVPYTKLDPLLKLLEYAASSPKVVSIKMTLYRLSSASSIIQSLVKAAEAGKSVIVVIELKARFDEQHNIDHATVLEEAGCQVIYGFEGYKVHSKLCLITEIDKGNTVYYTHFGTGNYNEITSKLYTDYHLITTNPKIGEDVRKTFNWLQLGNIEAFNEALTHTYTSPYLFKQTIIAHIEQEIINQQNSNKGHIIFKMNSLTDKDIIEALLKAARAHVRVDLIIRGINCLKPEHELEVEHIHIRSILGRYLEHSRVYYFKKTTTPFVLIGSADLMTRNTVKRIESAVEILDSSVIQSIYTSLTLMLSEDVSHYRQVKNQYEFHQGMRDAQMAHYSLPYANNEEPRSVRKAFEQLKSRLALMKKAKSY